MLHSLSIDDNDEFICARRYFPIILSLIFKIFFRDQFYKSMNNFVSASKTTNRLVLNQKEHKGRLEKVGLIWTRKRRFSDFYLYNWNKTEGSQARGCTLAQFEGVLLRKVSTLSKYWEFLAVRPEIKPFPTSRTIFYDCSQF